MKTTKIRSLSINSLIIEVTRFCPNQCAHCLRGESQQEYVASYDLESWISNLIRDNGVGGIQIGTLTLTGGEPLTPRGCDVISDIIGVLKRWNVEVQSFYIATSGVSLSEKAFLVCAELYAFCTDNELSQVHLSNDGFHEDCMEVDEEGLRLFQVMSFFGDKFNRDERGRAHRDYKLVPEGYAAENFGPMDWREIEPDTFMGDISYGVNEDTGVRGCDVRIVEGNLYFNVKGALIRGCDWSYDSQDGREDVMLCENACADFYNALISRVVKEIGEAGADEVDDNIEFNW